MASLQPNVASAEATQRSTTAGLIAGSSVLDTGIPAEGVSQKKFAIEYGGGAIFGGLVLGLLIAAIGAIVSDRLRRRDDVAAASVPRSGLAWHQVVSVPARQPGGRPEAGRRAPAGRCAERFR